MEQPRPWQPNDLMIRTKKNILLETFLFTATLLIWIYVAYAFLFFVTAIFNLSIEQINLLKIIINVKNREVTSFLMAVLFYWIIVTGLIYSWGLYSKYKYGRKKKPCVHDMTTFNDIMTLGYIDQSTYEQLQQAKIIELATNPIKDKRVDHD